MRRGRKESALDLDVPCVANDARFAKEPVTQLPVKVQMIDDRVRVAMAEGRRIERKRERAKKEIFSGILFKKSLHKHASIYSPFFLFSFSIS